MMAEHQKNLIEHTSYDEVSSSTSDSNTCPICLGQITYEAYLDQCFHRFCYNCILQWVRVIAGKRLPRPSSTKCPLCKAENFLIIHGYSGGSFQRHYVNQDLENSSFLSKTHMYRLKCYYTETGNLAEKFNVQRFWKLRKYLQPNSWLHNWLKREIQALTLDEDVDIIVHHIAGALDSFKRNKQDTKMVSPEAKEEFIRLVSEAARPFLTGRTDRFVNELEFFLASGLNIDAYDRVYIQHLGWSVPGIAAQDEEEPYEHPPRIPYLSFFDDDSQGNE